MTENYCKDCQKIVHGKNVKLNGFTRFICFAGHFNDERDFENIIVRETAEKPEGEHEFR